MNENKKNRKVKNSPKVESIVNTNYAPETDPFGSYTGKPVNKYEVPVQDQDDL